MKKPGVSKSRTANFQFCLKMSFSPTKAAVGLVVIMDRRTDNWNVPDMYTCRGAVQLIVDFNACPCSVLVVVVNICQSGEIRILVLVIKILTQKNKASNVIKEKPSPSSHGHF